jgi:putative transmembrane protein PGPGW
MIEFLRSRRKLGVVTGFLLVSVGLILAIPVVPGPGIPIVLLGLVILSAHFSWAKRLMDWVRQKSNLKRSRNCAEKLGGRNGREQRNIRKCA